MSSSSRILKEFGVHKHCRRKRQPINDIPQGHAASSNPRSSSQSGDAGDSENGESFNDHGNKFHNGGHGKNHDNDDKSSGSRRIVGLDSDGLDEDSGNDECIRTIGGSGTSGDNDDDKDDGDSELPVYDILDNDPRVHYTGAWVLEMARGLSTTYTTVGEGSTVSLRFNGKSHQSTLGDTNTHL